MRSPRYNRCDSCGRNAHKVAIRHPKGHVEGLCPSCFADDLSPQPWRPSREAEWVEKGYKVIYDRRGAAAQAATPVPDGMKPEVVR